MTSSSYVSLAPDFLSGKTSPAEFLETCLSKIAASEDVVGAFVTIDIESARRKAEESTARWKAGQPLSAIDGMPVGIKDIIETADMPTGQGSPMWEGFESGRDSATVQALRDAGAIILGKTTTTEFASSPTFARTTNPHDPKRTPGGSSSGSTAAVGAGFVPLALGSQVVGSTLRPSSFCGCVGFKPSTGGINRSGSYDHLSHSCVGVIGTNLEDVWLSAKAIVTRVGGDPGYRGLTGPANLPGAQTPKQLLVLQTDGWSRVTPGARAAFESVIAALAKSGIELIDRSTDAEVEAFERMIEDVRSLSNVILSWENRWPTAGYLRKNAGKVHPVTAARFNEARTLTQNDYAEALAHRQALRDAYALIAAKADGVVTLAATGAAPVGLVSTGDPGFNIPASIIGAPALSLPLLADEGLPLGVQVIGRRDEDAALFGLAAWLTQWHASAIN
ncbi:amidase [Neorhizobium sp. NCHU2750]|uniref:amidase n=1 Tax=Neorhizobium sp. NCHU2750 TaxID=1825976 RepID=UPI000E711299|nr:amidase [Neorhizobium sp. NCHU2750]